MFSDSSMEYFASGMQFVMNICVYKCWIMANKKGEVLATATDVGWINADEAHHRQWLHSISPFTPYVFDSGMWNTPASTRMRHQGTTFGENNGEEVEEEEGWGEEHSLLRKQLILSLHVTLVYNTVSSCDLFISWYIRDSTLSISISLLIYFFFSPFMAFFFNFIILLRASFKATCTSKQSNVFVTYLPFLFMFVFLSHKLFAVPQLSSVPRQNGWRLRRTIWYHREKWSVAHNSAPIIFCALGG